MIEVDQFSKNYGDVAAISQLTFDVQPGESLALVGSQDAGKTTALRVLSGILPATSGTIRIAGLDVNREPIALKQNVAYVPEDPQLFHELTVDQHLLFIASMYGVQDAEAKADRLLSRFALTPQRNVRPGNLSRGMRQKLAICCAYMCEPQVLLLDEPMTSLDPQGVRALRKSLRHWAELGRSVIISSRLLALVEEVCTHVLVLESGWNQFCGTLSDLRNHTAVTETHATAIGHGFDAESGKPLVEVPLATPSAP